MNRSRLVVGVLELFTVLRERSYEFRRMKDVGYCICLQPEVGWLLRHVSKHQLRICEGKGNNLTIFMHKYCSKKSTIALTVAGQQMRTSYLRPASRCGRRYHDSRPRGADFEGNWTGSCVGRIDCAGVKVGRRRLSRLGRTLGRTMAGGPRKMVFSTLAFTVQACVTTRSSPARTRIFGVQSLVESGEMKGGSSCYHVGQRNPIG